MRVKRGKITKKKHKKILAQTKGMKGLRTKSIKKAKEALTKALTYSYRDRRNRKRDLRSLWITRISAASKENGLNYSTLMKKLKDGKIEIDRKILAEIAATKPETFKKIVEKVK
ncbi:MAG: 50S ribosomal protein L20 [Patescibacteria group bacterium]|nr:50S ribosomal protein L20 [Patescibacteria group bacterium]